MNPYSGVGYLPQPGAARRRTGWGSAGKSNSGRRRLDTHQGYFSFCRPRIRLLENTDPDSTVFNSQFREHSSLEMGIEHQELEIYMLIAHTLNYLRSAL